MGKCKACLDDLTKGDHPHQAQYGPPHGTTCRCYDHQKASDILRFPVRCQVEDCPRWAALGTLLDGKCRCWPHREVDDQGRCTDLFLAPSRMCRHKDCFQEGCYVRHPPGQRLPTNTWRWCPLHKQDIQEAQRRRLHHSKLLSKGPRDSY